MGEQIKSMDEIKNYDDIAYPCENIDCISYQKYDFKRPPITKIYSGFPSNLIICLFCSKFMRKDYYRKKE
jgi:hypothetical protein